VVEPDEARRLFAWSVTEIDRRRQQGRATPRLFVVVDELRALIESDGFVEPVRRVTSLGREYGVHFIGATQYPTVDALGDSIIKRQLSVRLVGRVDSSDAAYVATGQKGTGAEKLAGAGDFLLIQPGDDTRRLTVAHLGDDDIAALPRLAEPRVLDLSEYEDLDHVQDVAKGYPRPDELEPDQVAVALASGRGITWLASELGIGSTKAGRVKQFADRMREKIEALGYALVPVGEL
jgi:DNA segregation ATPase FtsK/SpoIIIE-like protein